MVADMTYFTVNNIIDSWETIRRIQNYEEVAGVKLFRKLFELDPSIQNIFTFGENTKLNEEFFKSDRLVRHAQFFITMIDRALALLGPDIELLTEILLDLGKKHRQFGVKASHYPSMGKALLSVVEELLGDEFKPCVKDAWIEVYQALAYDMIRGPNAQ